MKLNIYANLLKLLFDSEKELGLTGLTECDRVILLAVIELSKTNGNEQPRSVFKIRHDEVVSSISCQGGAVMSKTQFFKSLKKFERLGVIQKVGSERSSDYQFLR